MGVNKNTDRQTVHTAAASDEIASTASRQTAKDIWLLLLAACAVHILYFNEK